MVICKGYYNLYYRDGLNVQKDNMTLKRIANQSMATKVGHDIIMLSYEQQEHYFELFNESQVAR